MTTVEEISEAIERLPTEQRWGLLHRFADELWQEWDREIEADLKRGALDGLLIEARAAIGAGKTRPLNEILGNH